MGDFIFSWPISAENRSYEEKSHCCFWKLELNDQWTLKYVCVQNNLASMEVHRKSLGCECIISGSLEIHDERNRKRLLKKKFICLLESSMLFSRIHLQYHHDADPAKPPPKICVVKGEVIIVDHISASLDLTEMVHVTKTDYLSLKQLSADMESLFLMKSASADASLKCGSISIPVHKSILSTRSSIFEALFSSPVKEATVNEVIIEDIEIPVLQAMLKYMYTGNFSSHALHLLVYPLLRAANKYEIVSLKSDCCKYFIPRMSMEYVDFFLLLGDLFSPDMKDFAIDLICNRCNDYSALEENTCWFVLKNENPSLALEIFSKVIKYQEKKLKMCA